MRKEPLRNGLDSSTIDDLVMAYRAGDIEAAEKLIECFKPLIGKFMNLFLHGFFNPRDEDVKTFLSCCGKKDLLVTAEIIKDKLKRYEIDELNQICKVALLETAYEYTNISGPYKYMLLKHLQVMLKEDFPEGMPFLELSEKDLLGHHYNIHKSDPIIDDQWVEGETAGEGFSALSKQQREIVRMVYLEKIPAIHVCRILDISQGMLDKEKQAIRKTLSESLNIR